MANAWECVRGMVSKWPEASAVGEEEIIKKSYSDYEPADRDLDGYVPNAVCTLPMKCTVLVRAE